MYLREGRVLYDLTQFMCFELKEPKSGESDWWHILGVLPRRKKKKPRLYDKVFLYKTKARDQAEKVYEAIIDGFKHSRTLLDISNGV